MWDLIVSVPGHCLSFYFAASVGISDSYIVRHSEFFKPVNVVA